MSKYSALPPIGRRPVPKLELAPTQEPQTEELSPAAVRSRPLGAAVLRLLIGSHLLLLIQSLLILVSGIDLGAARLGIAAISGIALAALVWAAFGRFAGRPRISGRTSGRHRDA